MKLAWRKLLAVAVLTGLVVAIWRLQPPRPRTGADFLPADTPACLIIADMPGAWRHWAASPASGTHHAASDGRVFATVWDEVPRWFKELGPLVVRGTDRFGDGEVFVALTGLQTTPTVAPELAVGIQFGMRRGGVGPWREELRGLLGRVFPKASPEKKQFQGKDDERWQPHPGLELCVAELEDYLVLTLGATPMMAIIERVADPSRETLAGSAEFRQVCRRLPPQRDVTLAVQAAPLTAKLDPLLRWLPQLQSLGEPFTGARFVGWAQSFGSNDVREAMVMVRTPAARQSPEPVPAAVLGKLPASCAAAVVARAEPREVFRVATRTVVELGQREWAKSVALMEVGWSAAGVDFAGDVLGSLGGVCVVAWDWPAEAKSPQVVFGAELRDAARFINATERIAASHQTAPVRWRMSDGWLWLSSSAAALENVSRAAAGAAPSLGGDPQWPKRLEGLPHNNWLWMYADTARLARGGQQESANHLAPLLACATALGDNNAVTVTSSLGTVATAWLALERLAGPVAGK